jgi:hypothetical protein
MATTMKRPDSNRTKEAKAIAIARRQTRLAIAKNGGRF